MNLVEIEKPASRWQGRKGRRSNRAPRVDCTRMKLYAEIGIGMRRLFGKCVEAAENEGDGETARAEVCVNARKQRGDSCFLANDERVWK
jgi:hypothetical protein